MMNGELIVCLGRCLHTFNFSDCTRDCVEWLGRIFSKNETIFFGIPFASFSFFASPLTKKAGMRPLFTD